MRGNITEGQQLEIQKSVDWRMDSVLTVTEFSDPSTREEPRAYYLPRRNARSLTRVYSQKRISTILL